MRSSNVLQSNAKGDESASLVSKHLIIQSSMNTQSTSNATENTKRVASLIFRAVLLFLVTIYVVASFVIKKWRAVGMKRLIILILEPILFVYVILQTLAGFVIGGLVRDAVNNPFSSRTAFDLGNALLAAFASLIIALIFTGAIFVLLRVKELLEEQIRLLKEINLSAQREMKIGQIGGSTQILAERQE